MLLGKSAFLQGEFIHFMLGIQKGLFKKSEKYRDHLGYSEQHWWYKNPIYLRNEGKAIKSGT